MGAFNKRIFQDNVGFLHPHTLLAILYMYFPLMFKEKLLGGDEQNIPKFWNEMHEHPSFNGHPVHKHIRRFG